MVKAIGDSISMSEYNSLVYLLRKFKRIVRHETISKVLETDIGTLNVTSGFINVGENFILENDVNIIGQNCLPLTIYSFTFYIVNADTSETVLETPVTLSGDTDKYGNLEITIPKNILSNGKEIKRKIKIEVTFQEHEGVSPTRLLNLDLVTDKKYIGNGETATVTATLLDADDEPLQDYTIYFDVNGTEISKITNSNGKAVLTVTGTGDTGVLNIKVLDKEINIIDYYFYDHATATDYNTNYWYGYWDIIHLSKSTKIILCNKGANNFCPSTSPTQLDITKRLEFDTPYIMEFDIYTCNKNVHLRVWDGNTSPYTVYFDYPINKIGHYKLIVNEKVIQLWIDNTLIKKQIMVTGDTSVSFISMKTDTADCKILEFANLIIYKYETHEPAIHDYSLSLTGSSIIERGDSVTITATLLDNRVAVAGATLKYKLKQGSRIIDDDSSVTDNNGKLDISYIGGGVGDIDVIVSFGEILQETFAFQDCVLYRETLSSNITDITLPPKYKLEFDMPSTSNGTYASIGTDSTHRIIIGQMSNDNPSLNGVWIYNGSVTPTRNNCPTTPTPNAHYTFIYEDGAYTMSNGGSSISGTIPTGIDMQKLLSSTYTPNAVRNYKIKAI